MDILHCYAYNECDIEVVVSVTFVPLDDSRERTVETRVATGHQTMLCTTYRNWVTLEARTSDQSHHWSHLELPLLKTEYTHVLSGVVVNPKNAPDRWPDVTTRQYACSPSVVAKRTGAKPLRGKP